MMKKLRWQILVVLVTLIVVAVLLLGQQPVLTQFVSQPTSGGVYTEGLVGSFSRLNPLFDLNNPADRDVDRLLFSGLVRFDSRGLPTGDLAESWGIAADGMIYNFTIRPGAVWHDGTPLTAEDVLFTIDLIRSPASFYPQDVKDLWAGVEVRILNDKNIKFVLPEPFAPFLDYLTFGVLPKHLLGALPADQLLNFEYNLSPIGSGPYRFERLLIENGQIAGVVLTAFADFYGQKPFIQQVVFRYYPDARQALQAYQAGEVLAVSNITPDVLQDALAEPDLSFYTSRLPQLSLVLFNLKNPQVEFLQNADVRRALLLGLNRSRMINVLMGGQAIQADGPILPGTWASYDGLTPVGYDPDAAVALLKAQGYALPAGGSGAREKDGQALAFTLLHPDDSLHTALAESIQQDWARIGVVVDLRAVPYDQLLYDHLDRRDFQSALVDLTLSRTPDPDPYPFWHQSEATGGQNYSQWDDRAASEYLEQARVLTDPAVRARLYRNFQIIFAKQLPALPLFYPVYTFAVDARVFDVQVAPLFDTSDRFSTIARWNLITRRALEETSAPTDAP